MAPKVYAHVLMYSSLIGITTAAAVGLSKLWSKTEEEKNNELLEKYPELVKRSQDQKKNMQAFFNKMKDPSNNDLDKDFSGLLHGGKGDIKRTQLWLDERNKQGSEAIPTTVKSEAEVPVGKSK